MFNNMKKILMTLAVLLCFATAATADQTAQEEAQARIEQKAKEADKHPKDGKKQLEASRALLDDTTGLDKNHDRALLYAERALAIANEQPVLQDTLKGLASFSLFRIYSLKEDFPKSMTYANMAIDAFQAELGHYSPLTIATKLVYGYGLLGPDPFRGASSILDAFVSNDAAPEDQHVENMAVANIAQEFAIEFLMAAATKRFRYALPVITYNGKKCLMLQTSEWNMERPLVGWSQSTLLGDAEEKEDSVQEAEPDPAILCELETQQCFVVPEEEKGKRQVIFSFGYDTRNPRHLVVREDNSFLLFFSKENHAKILNNFRAFKASLK
jgi:hypothetical protein